MEPDFTYHPIGVIRSCFTEKFGIPRQPGLVTAARAMLEVFSPYDHDEAFRDLDEFSHLWVLFVFHGIPAGKWRPTVRPPRLGGNRRTGVFATRSGFRPNPIGMSAVSLEGIRRQNGKLLLELSGIDLLDQTPVLDIKPYLPYADAIPRACGGFADRPPKNDLPVAWCPTAKKALTELEKTHPGFEELLEQVLGADPRPAYVDQHTDREEFGLRLYNVNVRWRIDDREIIVQAIEIDTKD
ncbi:tRNA (N6-threonylcarbamoyladenosine(37)-N6)-methyltransferase TrmO [Desulfosarcina widdelii]|uniref:tRNA (N6-threonylcarbamoyladenosine(37)-N6)-methyltransferase TrmO n=1 Tax=Desulfosarcina widdelii TaxID=947919 RepID=A0A5K7ZBN2_9BACT|nr:tRNA (N6-threonylcarbamoyladenosine(37)-N6)-methyltransferase TrmO [Desulfosarcina widdelii]BBO77173.1 tRNA (N6-threonylcarbamoyladenosine(37)-N6)-methyltransferase TrmO [Desulfosarcina widdelii]